MESTTPLPELLLSINLGKVSISNLYLPLDVSKKEIRVLRLSSIPSEEDDSIHCILSTISLEDDADFMPLSYVWGNASRTTKIFVNGISFQATRNLVDFFRHYRFLPIQYQNTALWVDAICINQNDLDERGQQVALMSEIYGAPPLTISWLGLESAEEKSDFAVDWIIKISKDVEEADDPESLEWLEKNAKDLLKGNTQGPVWSSIGSMLHRPYWTRVWTTQECVLPDENIFLCGSRHFYYSQLVRLNDAVDYTCGVGSSKLTATLSTAPKDEHYIRQLLTFTDFKLSDLGLINILNIKTLKSLRRTHGGFLEMIMGKDEEIELVQAWGATYAMKQLSASDPRDFVYGAGGMCPCPVIAIDYTKSTRDLFIEHAVLPIRATCYHQETSFMTMILGITGFGRGANVEELPSWVPNWGKTYSWAPSSDYNASGQKDTEWEKATMPVAEGPVLHAFGTSSSKVEFVQRRGDLNLMEFMAKILTDFYDSDWSPIEKFKEVLKVFLKRSYESSADSDNDALWVYTCALLTYFLDEGSADRDMAIRGVQQQKHQNSNTDGKRESMHLILETFGLYSHGQTPHDFWDHLFPDGLVSPLSSQQYEHITTKAQEKLMVIRLQDKHFKDIGQVNIRTENGYVGVTCGEVIAGDFLCVLFGCSQPVLLRKFRDHYMHIGLCFAVWLMDGEAFNDEEGEPGSVEILKFDIH